MPAQALAAVATLLSFAVHGNRIDLTLDRGSAELTWASERSFRFRRTLDGPLAPQVWEPLRAVAFQADELPGAVRLRSKYIEISIQKRGALVTVRRAEGEPVMADLSEPRAEGGGLVWERAMPEGARYYGLALSTDAGYDLRGRAVSADIPFLISSAGYGVYNVGASSAVKYDFTPKDRYRLQAPNIDYFCYYGPTPKRILEELHLTRTATGYVMPLGRGMQSGVVDSAAANPADGAVYWGWRSLRDIFLGLTHGAMAGDVAGYFNLDAFAKLPAEMLQRARQIGSLLPGVRHDTLDLSDFSRQLKSFFASYGPETRDKGYPLWHPLPMQFPDDAECANHADEFMLGDEMLVAPIYTPGNRRSVYLPPGVWTNLDTNAVEAGRRTIVVGTQSLPVFARNGTIIPLDSPGGMALHYFPSLGAEFFILETDAQQWTQVHAAPAMDVYRLEIESKVARAYQWVIHHVEKPSSVGFEELKYAQAGRPENLADNSWFYDAGQRNLHIKVRIAANEDLVIHVEW